MALLFRPPLEIMFAGTFDQVNSIDRDQLDVRLLLM